jgi:hypothetical protein
MTRKRIHTILREAVATTIAAAFLMGLLIIGNIFGQVS